MNVKIILHSCANIPFYRILNKALTDRLNSGLFKTLFSVKYSLKMFNEFRDYLTFPLYTLS